VSDRKPIRDARREARQKERESQGIASPSCSLCIVEHHPVGRNHDTNLTDHLCQKHHREMHELMLREGISLRYEPDPIKRLFVQLRATILYERKRNDALERWVNDAEREFLERSQE
jgi:hypothetical protein